MTQTFTVVQDFGSLCRCRRLPGRVSELMDERNCCWSKPPSITCTSNGGDRFGRHVVVDHGDFVTETKAHRLEAAAGRLAVTRRTAAATTDLATGGKKQVSCCDAKRASVAQTCA